MLVTDQLSGLFPGPRVLVATGSLSDKQHLQYHKTTPVTVSAAGDLLQAPCCNLVQAPSACFLPAGVDR